MLTRNKYRNSLKEFESLLHHCRSGSEKTKTDKVWLCEYVGNLKGVGQMVKAKKNELKIHMIADLQLYVCHHVIQKVRIRGFNQIYDISLQDLPVTPLLLSTNTGKQKICIFQDMEIDGWKN